jgi:hypothetical protein
LARAEYSPGFRLGGIGKADAEELRTILLSAAINDEALPGAASDYGHRFTVDFDLVRRGRRVRVRSAWIVRLGEDTPRLRLAMLEIEMHSVVATLEDLPEQGLVRGQVGTVVESWAPGVYEVEFSDGSGRTYAMTALRADQLIVLHQEPVHRAA